MYSIWRVFNPNLDLENKYIKTVFSEGEAQAHCKNPETRVDGKYYDTYKKEFE